MLEKSPEGTCSPESCSTPNKKLFVAWEQVVCNRCGRIQGQASRFCMHVKFGFEGEVRFKIGWVCLPKYGTLPLSCVCSLPTPLAPLQSPPRLQENAVFFTEHDHRHLFCKIKDTHPMISHDPFLKEQNFICSELSPSRIPEVTECDRWDIHSWLQGSVHHQCARGSNTP